MTAMPYGILPLVLTLFFSFTQENLPKLSPTPAEVTTAFFAAFEKGDYDTMKPLCTEASAAKNFGKEQAFGFKQARLVTLGEITQSKDGKTCHIAVTADTGEPKTAAKENAASQDTKALYLTLLKQADGAWRLDALSATPPASEADPATEAVRKAFLKSSASKDATITACVPAPDKAQGLLGVVQYTDAKQNPLNFAFVQEKDCIPYTLSPSNPSTIAKNSKLRYLGKGKIGFVLLDTVSMRLYDYTLLFTQEGNRTKFQAQSQERSD